MDTSSQMVVLHVFEFQHVVLRICLSFRIPHLQSPIDVGNPTVNVLVAKFLQVFFKVKDPVDLAFESAV